MEEYIKVSGKTVEDAVLEASIKLGTTSDNIDYRVIEKESKGFLGIGAKKAVIEAKKRKSDEELLDEALQAKAAPKAEVKAEKPAAPKAEVKAEKPAAPKAEVKAEEKPAKAPRVPADPQETCKIAHEFLDQMFKAMGMEVTIKETFENDNLDIELSGEESGEDMGVLIGKRGQTLDSIQYLTSLVVNKGKASYVRVKLDTENYRERRRATLENLAKNIAFKVKKTRRPVYLEPMNPYERRIIHSVLQNDAYVTTHSEGEEPNRKVVVTLKKRERVDAE